MGSLTKTLRHFGRQIAQPVTKRWSPSPSPCRTTATTATSKAGITVGTGAETAATTRTPAVAQLLGYAGTVPFLASALVATMAPDNGSRRAANVTQLYGASILSFLGGVHWGVALTEAPAATTTAVGRRLAVSVVPSLAAWGAALAPATVGLPVLAGSLGSMYVYDWYRFSGRFAGGGGGASSALVARWYLPMRAPLTVAALGACVVSWLAVRRRDEGAACPAGGGRGRSGRRPEDGGRAIAVQEVGGEAGGEGGVADGTVVARQAGVVAELGRDGGQSSDSAAAAAVMAVAADGPTEMGDAVDGEHDKSATA